METIISIRLVVLLLLLFLIVHLKHLLLIQILKHVAIFKLLTHRRPIYSSLLIIHLQLTWRHHLSIDYVLLVGILIILVLTIVILAA